MLLHSVANEGLTGWDPKLKTLTKESCHPGGFSQNPRSGNSHTKHIHRQNGGTLWDGKPSTINPVNTPYIT